MTATHKDPGLVDPTQEPWERLGPNLKSRALATIDHHRETIAEAQLELLADVDSFPADYEREHERGLLIGPHEHGGLHVVFTEPGQPPMACDLTEEQTVAFERTVQRAIESAQRVDLGDRHVNNELPWRGLRAKRIDDAGDHILVQCRFMRGDHREVVLARTEAERLVGAIAAA